MLVSEFIGTLNKIPQVVWIGHAMCDNSALECNHWFVFCQRLWYRWMNSEEAVYKEKSWFINHHYCYQFVMNCYTFIWEDTFTIFAKSALISCNSSSQDECRGSLQDPHSVQIWKYEESSVKNSVSWCFSSNRPEPLKLLSLLLPDACRLRPWSSLQHSSSSDKHW